MEVNGIIDQNFIDQQVAATATGDENTIGDFDPNMFLKILMVQLQNQSPYDTVDSQQILEQQALLTQVEQSARQTGTLQDVQSAVDIGLAGINETLGQINTSLAQIQTQLNEGT